uniref:Flocculation protein FLO11-like n=1 Tax=Panagrellus redivivus TaxID=6233 RepID=A0A7E4ZUV7_PANRE
MSMETLNIRGIPVHELLPRCYELSKTFAAPVDLGLFIMCIDVLPVNPLWKQISVNKTRASFVIPALEFLIFDSNFRSAISDLIVLWISNGKVHWDFDESPRDFPVIHGAVPSTFIIPTRTPSMTSVRSNDSGFMTSPGSSSASASSSSTSVASTSASTGTTSNDTHEAFERAAAKLRAHLNETISSGGSSSTPRASTPTPTKSRKRPSVDSSSSSNVSPSKPKPIGVPVKRSRTDADPCSSSVPGSSSSPCKVLSPADHTSPTSKPLPIPSCGHAAAIEIVRKQARVNVVEEITNELLSAIDSTRFSKEALLKYTKEKLAAIQKITSEPFSPVE